MKTINYKFPVVLLLLLALWSSCKITKPYIKPETSLPENYRDVAKGDTSNMATMKWSSLFTDTLLHSLIAEGLSANLDLKLAIERINESKASLRLSKAAYLPEINGTGSVKESKLSNPQGFGLFKSATQYDLGISASWEADIWGKLSSAKRAALASLLATEAAKRAVQTQLISDISNNYFELLALDEQLLVTRKTAKNRASDAEAIKLLFESSILNGVAVVQSEANYYEAELAIPDLEQRIKETEHALCLLLGRTPSEIRRGTLYSQKLSYDLNPGIPSQLLAQRPDVQEAEYLFKAAFENSNVARTYFYPALRITAAGGFSSFSLSEWFTNGGLFGNIAGSITQPILNKGVNKARLSTAQSKEQQALYSFQLSLLKASQEVSNALSAYQNAEKKDVNRIKQLKALNQAVDFNKELLNNNSNTNYTDVLAAEQNLLSAELRAVQDQSQKLHALVNLYRALGGGWN